MCRSSHSSSYRVDIKPGSPRYTPSLEQPDSVRPPPQAHGSMLQIGLGSCGLGVTPPPPNETMVVHEPISKVSATRLEIVTTGCSSAAGQCSGPFSLWKKQQHNGYFGCTVSKTCKSWRAKPKVQQRHTQCYISDACERPSDACV